jgi:hypothetical protein
MYFKIINSCMANLAIFAALFAFSMGVAVLCANPRRFTNQVFFVMSVIVTTHLIFIYYANRVCAVLPQGDTASPITMLRAGERVLVTADKGNAGSVKTILKNGGVLDAEELLPGHPDITQRFWITAG